MDRGKKTNILAVHGTQAFAAAMALAMGFSSGLVSADDSAPAWSRGGSPALARGTNSTFLMNTKIGSSNSQISLLDEHRALELRQEYGDMVRSYNDRSRYGLTSLEEERAHDAQLRGFSEHVMGTIRDYQIKANLKKMKKVVDRDPNLSQLKRPAAIAAAVAAFYNGAPMTVKVADDAEVAASAHIPSKRAQVSLRSSVVDTSLNYTSTVPSAAVNSSDDRIKFSLSKAIPSLDLQSALSYGSTTSALTASVSKKIIENLRLAIDTAKYMLPDRMESRNGNETVRFLYDLRF